MFDECVSISLNEVRKNYLEGKELFWKERKNVINRFWKYNNWYIK